MQRNAVDIGAATSETVDLYQAFLDLFPDVPNLPDYGLPQNQGLQSNSTMDPAVFHNSNAAYSEYSQATQGTSASMNWSIGDLLRASSVPQ